MEDVVKLLLNEMLEKRDDDDNEVEIEMELLERVEVDTGVNVELELEAAVLLEEVRTVATKLVVKLGLTVLLTVVLSVVVDLDNVDDALLLDKKEPDAVNVDKVEVELAVVLVEPELRLALTVAFVLDVKVEDPGWEVLDDKRLVLEFENRDVEAVVVVSDDDLPEDVVVDNAVAVVLVVIEVPFKLDTDDKLGIELTVESRVVMVVLELAYNDNVKDTLIGLLEVEDRLVVVANVVRVDERLDATVLIFDVDRRVRLDVVVEFEKLVIVDVLDVDIERTDVDVVLLALDIELLELELELKKRVIVDVLDVDMERSDVDVVLLVLDMALLELELEGTTNL
ncbi:hypothetical protein LTS15_000652 [Exophiala xenobiotica]|nr:hypothetical protein LTS15_000652 [Exophiala xenobiotica]